MAHPLRTCIGCGDKDEKQKLLRFTRHQNGTLLADPAARQPGRGVYVHRSTRCMEAVLDERRLSRAFRARTRPGAGLEDIVKAAVGPSGDQER